MPDTLQLIYAAQDGHVRRVKKLLAGIRGSAIDAKDGQGWTALHWACIGNKFKVARLLLSTGADPNSHNDIGYTPLHCASIHGYLNIVRLLISAGADVNAGSQTERTPFNLACDKNQLAVASLLLDAGADVNIASASGWTMLHHACWYGNPALVRYLLEKGADPGLKTQKHETPLDKVLELPETFESRKEILDVFQELAPEQYFSVFCTQSPGGP